MHELEVIGHKKENPFSLPSHPPHLLVQHLGIDLCGKAYKFRIKQQLCDSKYILYYPNGLIVYPITKSWEIPYKDIRYQWPKVFCTTTSKRNFVIPRCIINNERLLKYSKNKNVLRLAVVIKIFTSRIKMFGTGNASESLLWMVLMECP